MPSLYKEDLFGMDMIVSHGDHVESYITYAAARVPLVFSAAASSL